MYMRSVRLILCLLYGLDFSRTFDFGFASASTLPDLKFDGSSAKRHRETGLVSELANPSSRTHTKTIPEPIPDFSFTPRRKSANSPNEMVDVPKANQKPKRSEFIDVGLGTTNLESEEGKCEVRAFRGRRTVSPLKL